MSGFSGANTTEGGNQFASIGLSSVGSTLMNLLLVDEIVPGSSPSYQVCKEIYSSHVLGAKMAEAPINMAQSQLREITVPGAPEERLIAAFKREWAAIGKVGADVLIHNTVKTARIYGISSVVMGDRKHKPSTPIPLASLHELDVFFNVLDPLNTAGSLVLSQEPNSPDYQKPTAIRAGGQEWHPSRTVVMMNEQPVYIEFTNSAFGFVGRSVYQRALFPLKSFVQSMITDDLVTKKIGLLIAKIEAPGSYNTGRIQSLFGWKRAQLKSGVTGNVLQIGKDDSIESLNFQNLEGAGRFTRDNILKNIATAANMPARMLDQETLVSGFGEGAEDAKQIARYIDRVRIEMQPLYAFFDEIVQRRAWSPDFYVGIQRDHAEYKRVPYETAFYQWRNAFTAEWPNLLVEPDSEKMKVQDTRFKAVTAVAEIAAPLLADPENKAALMEWIADCVNNEKDLFPAPLLLDYDAMREYEPPGPVGTGGEEGSETKEPRPIPFDSEA